MALIWTIPSLIHDDSPLTKTQAGGNIGRNVLPHLIFANFKVTVITRRDGAEIPPNVEQRVVNYNSLESLTEALKGQDAVIDATSVSDPAIAIRIIDAAVAAGVSRFISAEFSADPRALNARSLSVSYVKRTSFEHLEQLAKDNRISFTAVSNSAFLDWNLETESMNTDVGKKTVQLLGKGNVVIPWTLLNEVGQATTNVLLNLEETRNRVVYTYDTQKSQVQMLDLAKQTLGDNNWEETTLDMEAVFQEALSRFSAGIINIQVISDMIRYSNSRADFAGPFTANDNSVLGVRTLEDSEIVALIKEIAIKHL